MIDFYSHAPCGARHNTWFEWLSQAEFLLTRPMRGATIKGTIIPNDYKISTHTPHAGRDRSSRQTIPRGKISTHTPHAGRDRKSKMQRKSCLISTHTPHAGRDRAKNSAGLSAAKFLLTRPMRGATNMMVNDYSRTAISTHTPHAGRDLHLRKNSRKSRYFYSHAPCGARLPCTPIITRRVISTHTPHAGRDCFQFGFV